MRTINLELPEFLRDVAAHQLTVIRDEGVYRHLRFARPGTSCYHFDLITWPGYLAYVGDMGSFTFTRVRDMLEFFRFDSRRDADKAFSIDFRYWAEKATAASTTGGLREFDPQAFVREISDQRRRLLVGYGRNMMQEDRLELWDELGEVMRSAERDGEHLAFSEVYNFSFSVDEVPTIRLCTDDFPSCQTYTRGFLWCCYALRWGVMRYDEAVAAQKAADAAFVATDKAVPVVAEVQP